MAPLDKLVKVGLDGFALLDEVYGRKKKSEGSRVPPPTTTQAYDRDNHHHPYHNYSNQQQYVYRRSKVMTVWEPVIDSNQAAEFYGGMSIVDYSMRKPIRGV